jgi:hypothetical protein
LGHKETQAKPISAQAEAGNGKLVRGLWNDEFLRELENFPPGKHDDEVDALSGAYEQIGGRGAPFEYERVEVDRRPRCFGDLSCLSAGHDRWSKKQDWH